MTVVKYVVMVLLLLLLVFNIGWNVAEQPITYVDESWYVASALEMHNAGSWVVNTICGQVDYISTKPPLIFWAVNAGHALPLPPLLGIRVVSLASGLLAAGAMFCLGYRRKDFLAGVLAVLLLFTIPDFITGHGARTSDCDMLFVSMLCFALLGFARNGTAAMAWGYGFLGMAFLAKDYHAIPYATAAFAYTVILVYRKELDWRRCLLLPLMFFVPLLPWIIARFQYDGMHYFVAMVQMDLLNRRIPQDNVNALHTMFYLNTIRLGLGLPLLAALVALCSKQARAALRVPEAGLYLLWFLIPVAVLVCVPNGFHWYIYGALPPLALLVALPVSAALRSERYLYLIGCGTLLVVALFGNEQRIQNWVLQVKMDPLTAGLERVRVLAHGQPVAVAIAGQHTPWIREIYATALVDGIRPVDSGPGVHPDYVIAGDGSVLAAGKP